MRRPLTRRRLTPPSRGVVCRRQSTTSRAGGHRAKGLVGLAAAARSHPARSSSPMPYRSSSAPGDVGLARIGLQIIGAMQPSAARAETVECVALRSSGAWQADVCFHDCDKATRPALTAVTGLSPATSLAGRWRFASRSSTASASTPTPTLHRLPHHRGDAAVPRARRDEWTSSLTTASWPPDTVRSAKEAKAGDAC